MKQSEPLTGLEVSAIKVALQGQLELCKEGHALAIAADRLTEEGIKESELFIQCTQSALDKINAATLENDFKNAPYDKSKYFKPKV
jgi:hypothetical protein